MKINPAPASICPTLLPLLACAVSASALESGGYLFARTNPVGLQGNAYTAATKELGAQSYLRGMAYGTSSPAYGFLGLGTEYSPHPVLQLKVALDNFFFYGTTGSLLEFDYASRHFDTADINDMKGREQRGTGRRLLVRPRLRGKAGRFIFINNFEAAFFWFDARGSYFYEREYDILVRNGGLVLDERFQIYRDFSKAGNNSLLIGPFYAYLKSHEAEIERQKVGLSALITDKVRSGYQRSYYIETAVYARDRNRERTVYLLGGVMFDWKKETPGPAIAH